MQRSIQYLRSLEAVRERSTAVCAKAKTTGAGLIHFEPVDWTRLQEVVAFVESLIRRDCRELGRCHVHVHDV